MKLTGAQFKIITVDHIRGPIVPKYQQSEVARNQDQMA